MVTKLRTKANPETNIHEFIALINIILSISSSKIFINIIEETICMNLFLFCFDNTLLYL